jgi:glutathione synthase
VSSRCGNIHGFSRRRRRESDAESTSTAFHITEIVRPKLVRDGIFLVGLDIVGEELMGSSVFSPGGPGVTQKIVKSNFGGPVVQAIKRKVRYVPC